MSTTTPSPDAPPADAPPADAPPDVPPDTGDDAKAELEKWKAQARKHEERAKANAKAVTELEQLRQSSMSDQEKAVAQAKAEGRTEALVEAATKVAAAEIRAAAAGRMADEQLDTLLEGLNLASFVGDDGEVDRVKVVKFVDGIAPKQEEGNGPPFPDLGQGSRGGGNTALNGDPLLRDVKNVLGIR